MGSNAYEVHVSFPVSGLQLARTVGQHHPLVLKEGTLFNATATTVSRFQASIVILQGHKLSLRLA